MGDLSQTWKKGEYASLARLAREKREHEEYINRLRAVLALCESARQSMISGGSFSPTKISFAIWSEISDAIDLAEQELRRLGVEL